MFRTRFLSLVSSTTVVMQGKPSSGPSQAGRDRRSRLFDRSVRTVRKEQDRTCPTPTTKGPDRIRLRTFHRQQTRYRRGHSYLDGRQSRNPSRTASRPRKVETDPAHGTRLRSRRNHPRNDNQSARLARQRKTRIQDPSDQQPCGRRVRPHRTRTPKRTPPPFREAIPRATTMTGSHWFPTGSRNHWIRLVPRFPPLQGTGTGTSQDQPGTSHQFQLTTEPVNPMTMPWWWACVVALPSERKNRLVMVARWLRTRKTSMVAGVSRMQLNLMSSCTRSPRR